MKKIILLILLIPLFALGQITVVKLGPFVKSVTWNNTATITSGGLTVDTNTLYVDAANNRVGIGTVTPDRILEIEGAVAAIHLDGTDCLIDIDRGNNQNAGEFRFTTSGEARWFVGQADADIGGGGTEFYIDETYGGGANPGIWVEPSGSGIGIETNTPDSNLTVAGSGHYTGNVLFDDAIIVGAPTGGNKGAGTINATAVYDDNTILTGDFVFESEYEMSDIGGMELFYTEKKHLPTLTSKAQLMKKNLSLGQRLNEVIVTIEVQAKYIVELEKRLSELERNAQ